MLAANTSRWTRRRTHRRDRPCRRPRRARPQACVTEPLVHAEGLRLVDGEGVEQRVAVDRAAEGRHLDDVVPRAAHGGKHEQCASDDRSHRRDVAVHDPHGVVRVTRPRVVVPRTRRRGPSLRAGHVMPVQGAVCPTRSRVRGTRRLSWCRQARARAWATPAFAAPGRWPPPDSVSATRDARRGAAVDAAALTPPAVGCVERLPVQPSARARRPSGTQAVRSRLSRDIRHLDRVTDGRGRASAEPTGSSHDLHRHAPHPGTGRLGPAGDRPARPAQVLRHRACRRRDRPGRRAR